MTSEDKRLLIVGSGGREHALAWKLKQSPQVSAVFVAPGNGGTAHMNGVSNAPIDVLDIDGLVAFARDNRIDLTMVGPEAPMAAGIVDAFQQHNLPICGPTQAAAQLESSKAFAKQFMLRHQIPTASAAAFDEYEAAAAYLRETFSAENPPVIKASGLAAGKGVIVCDALDAADVALKQMMLEQQFGAAGSTVLIEERLVGLEVSVIGFCDGRTIVPLAPVRDHKRVGDGDVGLNTGGMGAVTPPADVDAAVLEEIRRTILEPTMAGMQAEGMPFVGILFAGIMLTADGPKVLEFNCRFGDPETQVLLPLLESDLYEILLACTQGTLSEINVQMRDEACATVVMAANGYPEKYEKGLVIDGLESAETHPAVNVFHAGTAIVNETLVSSGGRILAISATDADLATAIQRAYAAVSTINIENAHYRRDIGHSSL